MRASLILTCLALLVPAVARADDATRPNILFIIIGERIPLQ